MSEISVTVAIFIVVGIVFVGLGIPLLLGRVPPNSWYGCRTNKSLSEERIWYAINRVTGKDLILTGSLTLISSLAVFIFGSSLSSNYAALILLSVLVLATAGMVLHSFSVLKHL
jgi:uncharacterized membrane protein